MQRFSARSALPFAVFGGVVLLLLCLALWARGFTADVGDARVAGRFAPFPLFQARALRDLTLSWNGMSLRFSGSTRPALAAYDISGDGRDIVFDTEMRLRLSPGSDAGGSLAITRLASTGGASTLVVPFSVSGVRELSAVPGTLAWKRAGRTFFLELPAGTQIDDEGRTLTLPAGAAGWTVRLRTEGVAVGAAAVSTIVRTAPASSAAAPSRLPDEKSMPTNEQLQTALSHFTDASFAGWTSSRFSPADGRWKLPDGSTAFSEDIGTALLAEAVARGSWQQYLPLWLDALARRQKASPDVQPAFTTSAYVGGVRDYARSAAARDAALIEKARALLAASDVSLLSIPGLIPLLLDHGSPEMPKAAGAFLAARSGARLDGGLEAGLLEGLADYAQLLDAGDTVISALKRAVDKGIMPLIRTADAGVYVDSGSGSVDIKNSIRCGSLLIRAGVIIQSSQAAAVGRGLVASALSLADGAGVLPSSLKLSSGHALGRAGMLLPENVYALLPLDSFLAREIPLPQLGQGAWIWTSARVISAQRAGAQITLVLGYPRGAAHHFILQGITPFTQVRLHGIPWHTDPTYFRYSDGWAYDSTTQTMYVKLTGKSDREELDIFS
jgi:hypothetical protein